MTESGKKLNVGVVGATGLVGQEVVRLLNERHFPYDELRLLATEDSAGEHVDVGDDEVAVAALSPGVYRGLDFVFLAGPARVCAAEAPRAVKAHAIVIDVSRAHRLDEEVPLCVPEVNGRALEEHRGLVSSPSGPVAPLAVALHAATRVADLQRVTVTVLTPASEAGIFGMEELSAQSVALFNQKDPPLDVFPQRLAFNAIPQVGAFDEGPDTEAETALAEELRKVLSLPDLVVIATLVRIPVFSGQATTVVVDCKSPVDVAAVRARLTAAPGVELVDEAEPGGYPMPGTISEMDEVQVGRVRAHGPTTFSMWIASDNLRKGSALNAVQIAERIVAEDLF